ncbi:MAG: nuclear transport factor 2 family protein [Terracidiphilus sp.]|jgi:ketosteroid isomerase-like protein
MYHYFVRRKIREVFRRLNRRDFDFVTRQFTPGAEHWFSGRHALSGGRHTPELIAAWYRRLGAVFEGIEFETKKIFVSGMPWKTFVAVEWADQVRDRAGRPLPNQGVFLITMCWGRATELHIYCDTKKLEENLAILVAQGVAEAGKEPIQDDSGLSMARN